MPSSDDIEAVEELEEEQELAEDGQLNVAGRWISWWVDETECPICQAKMPVGEIPKHIDRQCPPVKPKSKSAAHTGNQKSDWKKVFSGAGSSKTKELVSLSWTYLFSFSWQAGSRWNE
jgi:hypothetical protein